MCQSVVAHKESRKSNTFNLVHVGDVEFQFVSTML